MEITKLQWLDKKKCIVYIDYEIAFVLYKGDLRKYDLNEGGEFSEEILQEIMLSLFSEYNQSILKSKSAAALIKTLWTFLAARIGFEDLLLSKAR